MFLEEAQSASSVSDAHLVQVHEFGNEGDLDFIVMEYVDGKPLNKLIPGRPLPDFLDPGFSHSVSSRSRLRSRRHTEGGPIAPAPGLRDPGASRGLEWPRAQPET